MVEVPLHPALVHIPLGLAAVMPLLVAGITLCVVKQRCSRRAFWLAAALQALLALGAFFGMRTGEAEEDKVEKVVAKKVIEEHEAAAKAFTIAAAATCGLLAVAALLAIPLLGWLATLGTLAVLGLGIWTGKLGGELVYQHGAASAYAPR